MRADSVHTRGLLTYPISWTPLCGGVDESSGMAASLGDNGAQGAGVAGSAFVSRGAPRFIKGGACCDSYIFYVSIQVTCGGL